MNSDNFEKILNEQHQFPGSYTFKFVIKNDDCSHSQIQKVLENSKVSTRPSKNNKYVCYTATKKVLSASEVVSIYGQASKVKGILSL